MWCKYFILKQQELYQNKGEAGLRVTSPFNEVREKSIHKGVDLVGAYGWNAIDDIILPWDGVITKVGLHDKTAGNYVLINFTDNVCGAMKHIKDNTICVKQGVGYKAGTVVGTMGTTGNSTGVHLHFELMIDGEFVNPVNYLMGNKSFVKGGDKKMINENGYGILTDTCVLGENGNKVKYLQQCLISKWKYGCGAKGTDGRFGKDTQNAILQFQIDYGLPSTGQGDTTTINALNAEQGNILQGLLQTLRQIGEGVKK